MALLFDTDAISEVMCPKPGKLYLDPRSADQHGARCVPSRSQVQQLAYVGNADHT